MTDTITGYRKDQYLTRVNQTSATTQSTYTAPDVNGKTKLIYVVKDGDNLGFISEWYNVGLSELRYWNNIYRNTIRVGQKLSIYVDPGKAEYYSKINTMSFADKQKRAGNTAVSTPSANEPAKLPVTASADSDYEFYTVRTGDTIWDIAKMFDGVSATDILKLNNISDASKIQVGQRLRIRRKA
jgi:membrane-bound lytic murein transglycosylase D